MEEPHVYIRKLYSDIGVQVRVAANPLIGATVTVYTFYQGQLTQRPIPNNLSYSLNNVDFQTSNVFSGQVDGDYTIYIKDDLGCTVEKDFSIATGSSGRDAFIEISDLNSINFAESEIWNGNQNGIDKNPENVLSLTDRQQELYEETLIFRKEDSVRIQFKSNYDNHDVDLENCEGTALADVIVVEKMSKNLNLFEALDAWFIDYGDGLTAVYYTAGLTYDEAGTPNGSYELNGNLPDFAYVGNLVEIRISPGVLETHEILDVLYDDALGKRIFVIGLSGTSVTAEETATRAYYDLLPYEIYEFTIDFAPVLIQGGLDKKVRVRIQATDDLYDEVNFYSEYASMLEADEYNLDRFFSINYSNNNNRSIFYLYGITHFIRAEVLMSNAIIDDSVDVIKGDLTTYLAESVVNKGIRISFAEVTYKMMIKIVLAISSENLFINGLGYVKSEAVESLPVENTNLYLISCTLLSTNKNFNTFVNQAIGNEEGYKTLYIPGLVKTNLGGFLKI